jgi:hypothetical protein
MGFAKAGELNHYPGPKHVLELERELSLEKEQIDKTKETYNRMHKAAVSLGMRKKDPWIICSHHKKLTKKNFGE